MKNKKMHQTPFPREGGVCEPLNIARRSNEERQRPLRAPQSQSEPQSLVEYAEAELCVEIGRAVATDDFPFAPRLSEPKNLI